MQVAVEEGKDHVKDEEHIDGGLELRQEVDAVGDPVQRGTGTPALVEFWDPYRNKRFRRVIL